jgi:hypothetical protein
MPIQKGFRGVIPRVTLAFRQGLPLTQLLHLYFPACQRLILLS